MTPEEKFNQDVWWALQKIAEEKLTTLEGQPVVFEIVKLIAVGIPGQDRQKSIIHKLQEWGAIKILNESSADWRGNGRHIFELQKGNKLEGKIIFEFNDSKTQVMAKYFG